MHCTFERADVELNMVGLHLSLSLLLLQLDCACLLAAVIWSHGRGSLLDLVDFDLLLVLRVRYAHVMAALMLGKLN